jgi:hypothetical protein
MLVDLPVDLQPSGWRLTDRPGRDATRTAAYLRQDLDELAEAFDGWTGRLKLQVAGPWTLAASTWLPRGERVVSDSGATRDLVDSLAEGVRAHLATVQGCCRAPRSSCSSTSRPCPRLSTAGCPPRRAMGWCAPSTRRTR